MQPDSDDLIERLARVERLVTRDVEDAVAPAWRRATAGEHRWPFALAIAGMIGLQLMLPDRLTLGSRWLLPAVEIVLMAVLVAANPGRMERPTPVLRRVGLALTAVISLANAGSVALLVRDIATGHAPASAAQLLATGGAVWLLNVLTFAVWYWEFDRGGPQARSAGTHQYPDFLFPQLADDRLGRDWEPRFLDYVYLAFTNATAFSPTDTMPLSRWAKTAMLLQSAISVVIATLVVAKAVNALA
ncbi:DUF1345 domain-containing protein [Krasilnikovia sp. M28-CT-15]|uniref:DUF1345 domain-containing protein n=1 Tax=Krasilnikovia sp. M28-CT-15 TaxID=3373540 RepID=UPI003875F7BA